MADTNTPKSVVSEGHESVQGTIGSRALTLARSGTAQALLVLTLATSPALAQTNPVSSSTSANASADKGGGQVVKINGIEYTYAKIAGMKEDEQMGLINAMKNPLEKMKVGNFIRQAAIKEGERIDAGTQAAIDANKGKIEAQQAAIKEGENLNKQLIARYEQYITNIERGAKGERNVVIQIVRADITPEGLKKRAQRLLEGNNTLLASL